MAPREGVVACHLGLIGPVRFGKDSYMQAYSYSSPCFLAFSVFTTLFPSFVFRGWNLEIFSSRGLVDISL